MDDDLELGKGNDLIRLKMQSLDLEFDGGYQEYIQKMKLQMRGL